MLILYSILINIISANLLYFTCKCLEPYKLLICLYIGMYYFAYIHTSPNIYFGFGVPAFEEISVELDFNFLISPLLSLRSYVTGEWRSRKTLWLQNEKHLFLLLSPHKIQKTLLIEDIYTIYSLKGGYVFGGQGKETGAGEKKFYVWNALLLNCMY